MNRKQKDDLAHYSDALLQDVKKLIEQGRHQAVSAVNHAITMTYWHVGERINKEVLQGARAEYGKRVVASLAKDLVVLYGKSFETKNLRRMMQFAEVFTDTEIVVPLARQLSWSHFLALIPLKSNEARLFYAAKAAESGWSRRELLKMQKDNIMVAEYWTNLPPKELLEKKLHTALIEVREHLAERKLLREPND